MFFVFCFCVCVFFEGGGCPSLDTDPHRSIGVPYPKSNGKQAFWGKMVVPCLGFLGLDHESCEPEAERVAWLRGVERGRAAGRGRAGPDGGVAVFVLLFSPTAYYLRKVGGGEANFVEKTWNTTGTSCGQDAVGSEKA